ncbi:MAG: ATP-binding protein [Lachnospiraceae bacterium]|nr:ATP-binding protein [Lachnospiraceae bacterium]MDE7183026.1 ATP-binding protein [Lachnospiraceae bacterium]
MRRCFNVTGSCIPKRHYMVKLDERLRRIKEEFVDVGSYFVINRGRQYGKTTTLDALKTYLKEDYVVLSLDFQQIATADFADAPAFVQAFAEVLLETLEISGLGGTEELMEPLKELVQKGQNRLKDLFVRLSAMCKNSPRPVVLMIDEVDSASNNQVFIDFLAMLRAYYLKREERSTFHSVILAGVYSIKNLKLKLRPESDHQYNSPWNIAADFNIDMSFSPVQIEGMLAEYEQDYHTGMDLLAVAEGIYAYTSGYPVLVSLVCKHIAEMAARREYFVKPEMAWSKQGIERAVGIILKESTLLFESMAKQLDTYKDLYKIVEDILYCGKRIPFSMEENAINLGVMFGFIKEENGHVAIANRMFEMCLLNMFMAREAIDSDVYTQGGIDRIGFIRNNRLNMDLVLKKFVEYFTEIYSEKDTKFVEKYGRKFFLLYLKPIINGTGNYYIEAQTRDERRTDVVIDYLGEQFIVELKIWHGTEYNERGKEQLSEYLDYYNKKKGYLLSFNFNKNKKIGVKEIKIGDKTIVEAVV